MKTLSVRCRLMLWLLLPLAAVFALGVMVAYNIALKATQNSFDLFLLDTALDLADQLKIIQDNTVVFEISPSAQHVLGQMMGNKVYFAIHNTDGEVIAGNRGFPPPPQELQMKQRAYYNTFYRGEALRAVTLLTPLSDAFVHIQVAQPANAHDALLRHLLLEMLVPVALVPLTAVIAIWFAVRRGLRPVDEMSEQLARRSHDDLRPLSLREVPRELQPVVDEVNELLQRIRLGQENRNRFLSNAAHQLRTPLAALQAQVDGLRMHYNDALTADAVEALWVSVRRTTHLANQLLALARAEPGGIADQRQLVQLDALVRELGLEWAPRAIAAGLEPEFQLQPASAKVNALLVRELVSNLLDNVVRYVPSGGWVWVKTGEDGAGAWIDVADNGPGIPASERHRVVERFYCLQGATGDGCGLGLAIVDEIARAHQAQLLLDSGPDGQGLSVRVVFPVEPTV